MKVLIYGGIENYDFLNELRKKFGNLHGDERELSLPEWNSFLELVRTTLEKPLAFNLVPLFLKEIAFTFISLKPSIYYYAQAISKKDKYISTFSIRLVELELESSHSQLEGEIDFLKMQVSSSEAVLSDAQDLYSRWHCLPYEDRRTIVESITEEIIIDRQDVTLKLAYLPAHIRPAKSGKRQHNYRDVLPCLRYESQTRKPLPLSCPENPVSIGDHIRKKRMQLKLLQKDVAKICCVTEDCITNWKNIETFLKFNISHISSSFCDTYRLKLI